MVVTATIIKLRVQPPCFLLLAPRHGGLLRQPPRRRTLAAPMSGCSRRSLSTTCTQLPLRLATSILPLLAWFCSSFYHLSTASLVYRPGGLVLSLSSIRHLSTACTGLVTLEHHTPPCSEYRLSLAGPASKVRQYCLVLIESACHVLRGMY
eukprot:1113304-Rhodomonas_salina.1